jgi:cytoskeletal protein CcmA (bactofilin family)
MFGKKGAATGSVTMVAKGDALEGTLRIAGQLHVDGEIVGSVIAEGPVSIGPEGKVKGEVRGQDVAIAGRVEGVVRAKGSLHMLPTGVVEGDAYFQTLQVDRGGVIYGHTGKEGEGPKRGARPTDDGERKVESSGETESIKLAASR